MSRFDDDLFEMDGDGDPRGLAGGPYGGADGEVAAVGAFLADLRALAVLDAPEPSPELAALLDGAVPLAARRARHTTVRRIAVGAAAAVAALVASAATHTIPPRAQRVVDDVVNTLTPFDLTPPHPVRPRPGDAPTPVPVAPVPASTPENDDAPPVGSPGTPSESDPATGEDGGPVGSGSTAGGGTSGGGANSGSDDGAPVGTAGTGATGNGGSGESEDTGVGAVSGGGAVPAPPRGGDN